jgi:hypothetical protein
MGREPRAGIMEPTLHGSEKLEGDGNGALALNAAEHNYL